MPGYRDYGYFTLAVLAPPPGGGGPAAPGAVLLLWWSDARPGAAPAVATAGAALRDWDVLSALTAALDATGAFDAVHLGAPAEGLGFGAGEGAAAVLEPDGWDETDEWDDPTAVGSPRKVEYTLTVLVRSSDPQQRDRDADRLADAAQDALDGVSVGGLTLPGLTKLRRGRWHRAVPPERRIAMAGEATYLVAGFSGHDLTP